MTKDISKKKTYFFLFCCTLAIFFLIYKLLIISCETYEKYKNKEKLDVIVNKKSDDIKDKLQKLQKKKEFAKNIDKNDKQMQKLIAKEKYFKYLLNEKYEDNLVHINYENQLTPSSICIIMTGDEQIFPFYGKSIDINYTYCKHMGYDFKAVIGRILDKDKYTPHYDRYKLLLDCMVDQKYKYILYIDSDAYIQNSEQKIEHFINMMDKDHILLASWDHRQTYKDKRILPINSGVLLVKNCEKSIKFFNDILTEHPDCYLKRCNCIGTNPIKYYDQCVIDRLTEYHKYIKLLPYGILQLFNKNINYAVGEIDTNNENFIFHLAGDTESDRIYNIKNYKMKQALKNIKFSVFILNYDRPHNIHKQILSLSDNNNIDEIVISNGHPQHKISLSDIENNSKIVIKDDFENNSKIYTARRWYGIPTCKNEYVLNLDDDIIPSNELIYELLYKVHKNPMNIYGPMKRFCSVNGGYEMKSEKYNSIITPILMTSRKLIQNFLDKGINTYIDWIKKYKGNCEDLSLNMYLQSQNIYPVFVNGKYTHLDTTNGFSSLANHNLVRKEFCKLYGGNKEVNESKESKESKENNLYAEYRLGDMVRSETHRSKSNGRQLHYEKYPDSLATQYMKLTNTNNNYSILKTLVTKYDSKIIPSPHELVIHLRVGEVLDSSKYTVDEHLKDYKKYHNPAQTNYVYPLSYYKEKLDKLEKLEQFKHIKSVVLVCGGCFTFSTKSKEYISKIEAFLKDKGFKVSTRQNKNPDEDFVFMCRSNHFIKSGGGFSDLIEKIK